MLSNVCAVLLFLSPPLYVNPGVTRQVKILLLLARSLKRSRMQFETWRWAAHRSIGLHGAI